MGIKRQHMHTVLVYGVAVATRSSGVGVAADAPSNASSILTHCHNGRKTLMANGAGTTGRAPAQHAWHCSLQVTKRWGAMRVWTASL